MNEQTKPAVWIGSSHEDWKGFPDDVQDVMGYALNLAQCGEKPHNANRRATARLMIDFWTPCHKN